MAGSGLAPKVKQEGAANLLTFLKSASLSPTKLTCRALPLIVEYSYGPAGNFVRRLDVETEPTLISLGAVSGCRGGPMSRRANHSRRRAKTRPVTIRAAWIAGICAIAAAIIGAVVAYVLPSSSAAPSASPVTSVTAATGSPDLKVDEVEIALASHIDASDVIPGDVTASPDTATGSAIDITLRNSGNAPALIVNAVFSFTRTIQLYSCPGGAGALVSSAEYDVKVPTTGPTATNSPFILHRDMRFIVNANSIDRFRISVGPDQYSSVDWPWIYEFSLSLVEDNGQKLDLGPMTVLGFSQPAKEPFSWDPLQYLPESEVVANPQLVTCVSHDAAELSHALADPGLHSPELLTMYREAERLVANA
jgi:hypothetical protein